MIYKIYTSRYETIKFLYGLGKGHQQFKFFYKFITMVPIFLPCRGSIEVSLLYFLVIPAGILQAPFFYTGDVPRYVFVSILSSNYKIVILMQNWTPDWERKAKRDLVRYIFKIANFVLAGVHAAIFGELRVCWRLSFHICIDIISKLTLLLCIKWVS